MISRFAAKAGRILLGVILSLSAYTAQALPVIAGEEASGEQAVAAAMDFERAVARATPLDLLDRMQPASVSAPAAAPPDSHLERLDERYLQESVELASQGYYEQALNLCSQALRLNPRFAPALCERGIIFLKMNEADDARRDLNAALAINPRLERAMLARSIVSYGERDFKQAQRDIERLLKINARSGEGLIILGNCQDEQGKYSNALGSYMQALSVFETERDRQGVSYARYQVFDSHRRTGRQMAFSGNFAGAIKELYRGIEYNKYSASTYCDIAACQAALGALPQAYDNLSRALAYAPLYETAYVERARVQYMNANYRGAIVDVEAALRINPDNADAYYLRGLCRMATGAAEVAARDFEEARRLYLALGESPPSSRAARFEESGLDVL